MQYSVNELKKGKMGKAGNCVQSRRSYLEKLGDKEHEKSGQNRDWSSWRANQVAVEFAWSVLDASAVHRLEWTVVLVGLDGFLVMQLTEEVKLKVQVYRSVSEIHWEPKNIFLKTWTFKDNFSFFTRPEVTKTRNWLWHPTWWLEMAIGSARMVQITASLQSGVVRLPS